ncbi:MAG: carboxypeptidase regulatory-like domain-containing protein [Planctomycetes bacterium]|nr:carboxypeptidase regulatory-like domain-containing protein [Planctomycetota bacterium]
MRRSWIVILIIVAALAAFVIYYVPRGGARDDRAEGGAASKMADRETASAGSRELQPSAPATTPPRILDAASLPSPAAAPDAGSALIVFGSVLDGEGRGVEEADLKFKNAAGREIITSVKARPAYSVAGLDAGKWTVTANAAAFAAFEQSFEIAARPEFQRFDIVMNRLWIINIKFVTPYGKPFQEEYRKLVPDAERFIEPAAFASFAEPPRTLPKTPWNGYDWSSLGHYERASDARLDGRASQNDYDGILRITVNPPFCVSATWRSLVLSTVHVDTPVSELIIAADPELLKSKLCTIRARLVDDQSGAAVKGVSVHAMTRQGGGKFAVSDDSGTATINNILPGTLVIEVEGVAKGYASFSQYCNIDPSSDLTVDVRLTRPVSILGTVTDENGKPLSGNVFARYPDPVEWPHVNDLGGVIPIDTNGVLYLKRVARGKVILTFSRPGIGYLYSGVELFAGPVAVDTTHGSVENVHLVARPLDGKLIIDGTGCSPWPRLATILNDEGLVVLAEYITNTRVERPLRRGNYTIRVDADGEAPREFHAAVAAAPAEIFICK